MIRGDSQFDWRAVGALATLLVSLFLIANFLTNDKIDSKVQQHEILTETKHSLDIADIRRDLAVVGTKQEAVIQSIEDLKKQNEKIIKKLNES